MIVGVFVGTAVIVGVAPIGATVEGVGAGAHAASAAPRGKARQSIERIRLRRWFMRCS
jgi:hypothetical protein